MPLRDRLLCLTLLTLLAAAGCAEDDPLATSIDAVEADESMHVPPDHGRFRLTTFAGSCVAVGSASTQPGARLIQWPCTGRDEQLWTSDYIGSGDWFRLRNIHSGMCVGVNNGSHAHGEPLIQWPCNPANTNERWKLVAVDGGGVRLVNYATGQSMAVAGADLRNAAPIIQWDREDVVEQYFYPY
jgi:Ricin-type beta-trefoil lectin domain-like